MTPTVLILIALATAFSPSWPGGGHARAQSTSASTRVLVCGIDRTGSHRLVKLGIAICSRVAATARPGDTFVARWISGTSYAPEEHIVRFRVPAVRTCSNRLDAQCLRGRRADAARTMAVKRAAITRLSSQQPAEADRTDIYGFFQAASDIIRAAPDLGAGSQVWAVTDLVDNVRFAAAPDLRNANLFISYQPDNDPAVSRARQQKWTDYFRRHGAQRVLFQPAEVQK